MNLVFKTILRSNIPQDSIANQEEVSAGLIPASLEAEKPELQLEETLTTSQDTPTPPIERVRFDPQGVPEKHYPSRKRCTPRYLADFVTK